MTYEQTRWFVFGAAAVAFAWFAFKALQQFQRSRESKHAMELQTEATWNKRYCEMAQKVASLHTDLRHMRTDVEYASQQASKAAEQTESLAQDLTEHITLSTDNAVAVLKDQVDQMVNESISLTRSHMTTTIRDARNSIETLIRDINE